jgi:peroxiredoxin
MKRASIFLTAVIAAILFVSFANIGNAEDVFPIGKKLDNFELTDTSGVKRSFEDLKGKNGTVILFTSAQCPVVKMYDERISQIVKDYEAKGIAFIGINSNSTESLEWMKSHAEEKYTFPVLVDTNNLFADKLGATVTPEFYQFDAENKLVFHGPQDNDRRGEKITNNYLSDALTAMLGGKAVTETRANAFGCSIKRVGMKGKNE